MTHQTPCEELGYKVGDRFEVVTDEGHDGEYVGDTVTLRRDDGSNCPIFTHDKSGDNCRCFYLSAIKPHKPATNTLQALIEATKRKDEALQRLESELLELGYKLVAVDAEPDPVGDMSDWRNWREGDLVECVQRSSSEAYLKGYIYPVKCVIEDTVYTQTDSLGAHDNGFRSRNFKFHSRPKVSV